MPPRQQENPRSGGSLRQRDTWEGGLLAEPALVPPPSSGSGRQDVLGEPEHVVRVDRSLHL